MTECFWKLFCIMRILLNMPYRTLHLANLTQSKPFQTDVKLRHVEVLFYIFVALPI